MEQEKILDNKAIGSNISMYRKIRGFKASDIAERLGISESSYTRYERGETSITVDLVKQIADELKIDPVTLLSVHPSNFIDNANSPNSIVISSNSNYMNESELSTTNQDQMKMMMKLMESVTALSEKLIALLEKK
ncbi:MAG TPA: helix-turn-helix transcriptional regulator [Ohtaekwangia sp.]|uniref:helix-turn-helix domain-containing protein n=1 Tax=Ohtaekwangia sp. TaxID=2066019 RepID=UPI002F92AE91